MIAYLTNSEIDRDMWDTCILNSHELKPYGYSWFLDIMAPGWQALADDDYDSVFPLPGFSRFGIRYLATPIFLQQLGVFSPDKLSPDRLNEFLEYLPVFYRLIDLCVGQKIEHEDFSITEKINFELNLSLNYNKLWEGFSSDCRRNISLAAKRKQELTDNVSPDEVINLFMLNSGLKIKGIKPRDYDRLKRLMTYCVDNKRGEILGVRSSKGKLIFGIFLVKIPGSVTVLFTVNTLESRAKRSGYYVINEIVKKYCSTKIRLDFAGSSIPSIASFMSSFGGEKVPYYRIYRNRLFWPVSKFK